MDPRSKQPPEQFKQSGTQLLILFFGLHLSPYIYVPELLLHPICYNNKAFWHPFLGTLQLKRV